MFSHHITKLLFHFANRTCQTLYVYLNFRNGGGFILNPQHVKYKEDQLSRCILALVLNHALNMARISSFVAIHNLLTIKT